MTPATLDHDSSKIVVDRGGPHQGVGRDNPDKSSFIRGFDLTPQERADVLAFLDSLTDEQFLTDPALADPWQ